MDKTDKLLKAFYAGNIKQSDLDRLFDAFLNDAAVREKYPEDAPVIIPLALAKKDGRERLPIAKVRWKVAVAIIGISLLASIAVMYIMDQQTRVYSSDGDCDIACAEEWLDKTIETAL